VTLWSRPEAQEPILAESEKPIAAIEPMVLTKDAGIPILVKNDSQLETRPGIMLLDLVKTGTLAALQGCIAFAVAYLLTGSLDIAVGLALIGSCANSFVFFLHERSWAAARRYLAG
jgi:uncharacterized membrane protein